MDASAAADGDSKGTVVDTPQPTIKPVEAKERIGSIDVLRGCALLGILAVNISFFAYPDAVMMDPTVIGGFSGANLWVWKIIQVVFYQKTMTLFSMLFGAGLILFAARVTAKGGDARKVYYRRILWLLVIGLCHAYLLWNGDILVYYAICGLLLYLFRKLSPVKLLIIGFILMGVGSVVQMGIGAGIGYVRERAIAAQEAVDAGETPADDDRQWMTMWSQMKVGFEPSEEFIDGEVEAFQGGYGDVWLHRLPYLIQMQIFGFIFMIGWKVGGLMLWGMALMKLAVFSAERSFRFYWLCLVIGYGVGIPLSAYAAGDMIAHDFDIARSFLFDWQIDNVAALFVSFGHIGAVMLICKRGFFGWMTNRLAAVGRMALTNYLMTTVICTTIFYGYGFGLFGEIERIGLAGFVAAIWIVQLAYSPVWLKHFRFGPAEWLWRALTYGRRPAMRIVEHAKEVSPAA